MRSSADGALRKMMVDLGRSHSLSANACEVFVNRALAGTLRRKKLTKVRLDRAIFSRIGDALVVNGSIPLKNNVTKRHLRKQVHAVGWPTRFHSLTR
jgi:hypothetical protein